MAITPEDIKTMREELKWVTITEKEQQTFWEKTQQKFSQNPIVPIGCLLTAGILCRGLYFLHKGDRVKQQKYMRYRVGAQGLTIFALMIGVMLFENK